MFFLPFYRYPPLSRGLSCFCGNCKKQWQELFGNTRSYKSIVKDFTVFNRWQDYKSENMIYFIKELKEKTNYYIAPEIDIDPVRGLFEGIQLNDCQEILAMNQFVDEYIVHFYDKSGYETMLKDLENQQGLINAYSFFRDLYKTQKKYSLFFWNNGTNFDEYKAKLSISESIMAETVFFLINSQQVTVLNKLIDWRDNQ